MMLNAIAIPSNDFRPRPTPLLIFLIFAHRTASTMYSSIRIAFIIVVEIVDELFREQFDFEEEPPPLDDPPPWLGAIERKCGRPNRHLQKWIRRRISVEGCFVFSARLERQFGAKVWREAVARPLGTIATGS